MAAVFSNLPVLRRGKELFYCFTEARSKLFPNIEEDYLRNAVQYLGIDLLISSVEETATVQNVLSSQTGPFSLISEQNLLRLHAMLLSSRQHQFPFGAINMTSF